MNAQWMVSLYPRQWRERYGDEFLHMLEAQGMSVAVFLDVLAGAIDARLHSDYPLVDSAQEDSMFRRSAGDGSGMVAEVLSFGAPLVVLLAYVALWWSMAASWGRTPVTEAFQYAAPAATLFVSWGIQRLRLHSHTAKAAVMVLALAVFYGISFVATTARVSDLKCLIRLYPRAWRARYGDEFAAPAGVLHFRTNL